MRLHERDVRAVDRAVDGNIFAEVTGCYRLTRLRLRLRDIARVHRPVPGGVAGENAHENGNIAERRAVIYPEQIDRQRLSVADVCQIDGDRAAVLRETGNGSSPATLRRCDHVRHHDRCSERDDDGVITARPTGSRFDSRWTSDRKIDIKVSGRAMRFA